MYIWVEEEYGYKDYVWNAPFETTDELKEWWKNLTAEELHRAVFGGVASHENPARWMQECFGGKFIEIIPDMTDMPEPYPINTDAYIHIHEESDSCLQIGQDKVKYDFDGGEFYEYIVS